LKIVLAYKTIIILKYVVEMIQNYLKPYVTQANLRISATQA